MFDPVNIQRKKINKRVEVAEDIFQFINIFATIKSVNILNKSAVFNVLILLTFHSSLLS